MIQYVGFKEFTTCLVALYEEPRPPVEDYLHRLRWDTIQQFGLYDHHVVYGVRPTKKQYRNPGPSTLICWRCLPDIEAKRHWKRYVKNSDRHPPIFWCCMCERLVGP